LRAAASSRRAVDHLSAVRRDRRQYRGPRLSLSRRRDRGRSRRVRRLVGRTTRGSAKRGSGAGQGAPASDRAGVWGRAPHVKVAGGMAARPLFHHIDLRVMWADTDPAGIVWFGVFFRYFENAEEQLFLRLGRDRTRFLDELSIFMPRTSVQSRFRSPAKL